MIHRILMNRIRATTEAKMDDGKMLYHRSTTKTKFWDVCLEKLRFFRGGVTKPLKPIDET